MWPGPPSLTHRTRLCLCTLHYGPSGAFHTLPQPSLPEGPTRKPPRAMAQHRGRWLRTRLWVAILRSVAS